MNIDELYSLLYHFMVLNIIIIGIINHFCVSYYVFDVSRQRLCQLSRYMEQCNKHNSIKHCFSIELFCLELRAKVIYRERGQ